MTKVPLWYKKKKKENALLVSFTSEQSKITTMFGGICCISQILQLH